MGGAGRCLLSLCRVGAGRCFLSVAPSTFLVLRHRCGFSRDTWKAISLTHYQFTLWLPFTSGTWSLIIAHPCMHFPQVVAMPAPHRGASVLPTHLISDTVYAELLSPFPIGLCPLSCHSVPDSKIISRLNLPWGTWVIVSASCSNNSLWLAWKAIFHSWAYHEMIIAPYTFGFCLQPSLWLSHAARLWFSFPIPS